MHGSLLSVWAGCVCCPLNQLKSLERKFDKMFNDKLFDNLKETWDGLPNAVQKQIIDALADRGIIIDPENPVLPDTEVAQE